jgi:hypothetical protein
MGQPAVCQQPQSRSKSSFQTEPSLSSGCTTNWWSAARVDEARQTQLPDGFANPFKILSKRVVNPATDATVVAAIFVHQVGPT